MRGRFLICKSVLAGALVAVLGQGALAGDMKVSGKVVYVATPLVSTALAGGKKMDRAHLRGIMLSDDASSSLNLSAQDCLGATVTGGGGEVIEQVGSCTAADKDGDTWSLWYRNAADARTWTVVSGTGKYQGMTGAGTSTVIGGTSDGRAAISYEGTLQMK